MYKRVLRDEFQGLVPPLALDLLDKLLNLDPKARCSAKEAIESPWLAHVDCDEVKIPLTPGGEEFHEMEMKRRKRQQHQQQYHPPSSSFQRVSFL